EEDGRSEHRRDPAGTGDCRRRVAEQPRQHVAPDQDGDGEHDGQPELVAEHRDGMSGVLVVRTVIMRRHPTRGMRRVGRSYRILIVVAAVMPWRMSCPVSWLTSCVMVAVMAPVAL